MAYHWNQDTGRFEDENGNPTTGAVPMDQMQGAGNAAPGSLAANARAGADLSQPVAFDRPAVTAPLPSPTVMPLATPTTSPMPMPPEVQKTGQKTTVTREQPAAGEGAALQALQGDYARGAETARAEGGILTRQAGVTAAGEQESAVQAQARADAIAQEQEKRNAAIAAAQARVEQDRQKFEAERQKLSGMDIKDVYEGHPGYRIGKSILVALGELGAGLQRLGGAGGSNVALSIINANEQQWYANQRARIEKQKERVAGAEKSMAYAEQQVQGERQAKADALADLNLIAAARSDALAGKIRAEAAQIGTEHAAIMGEKLAQAEEQKRDNFLLQYKAGFRAKLATETESSTGPATAGAGRGMTEQMKKAALAAQLADDFRNGGDQELSEGAKARILKNDRLMESQKHSQLATWLQGLAPGGMVPTNRYEGLSPRETQIANSQRLMAEKAAALNYTAGGEKSLEAMVSEFDPTIPGGGNSRQKIDNIRNIMNANAGLAGAQMGIARAGVQSGAAGAPIPTKATAQGGRPGRVNGRPAIIYPDGHYELQ
jgi:hypothetical protein